MTTCKICILPLLAVFFNISLYSQSKVENLIAGAEARIEAVDSKILEIENGIQTAYDSVMTYKKYVDKLDSARLFNLPVSILGSGKDPRYGILIDEVILKPDGAYFNASMLMTNPFDGSRMCFQAQNIPFSFTGGIVGDARIMLVSQKKFTICNGVQLFVLPGTYVEFNCNGFKSVNLKGKVAFSGDKFVKVNAQGDSIGGALEAYFETKVNDWNNLFLSIEQLDPFKLKSIPDVIFSCKNLAIDYSDYQNPSNIVFPASYVSSFPAGSANLWRGVYMTEATIMLDKKFKKKDSQSLVSFAAKNLLIDEKGLSGELSGKNLLSLQEGDLSGWSFSLDYLNIKLDASRIKAANFNGEVMIPAFKDSTKFGYSALIDTEGKYNFTVTTQSDLPFELFGQSKLTINKSSYISITVDKGKFKPVACLTGALDINVSNMKMAGIRFEELRIATEAPVISVKNLAVDANMQGSFANFPLTVNNIDFRMPGDLATLKFKAKLNLMGSSDEGFSGLCDITLKSRRENYKYKLQGVQINEIKVDVIKNGAFELHGQIMFAHEDPVYGNGFRGMIKAKFASTFEVNALAIFGNVKGTRYFFVDAFLGIKPGIPAGPITLYGFSGGLYYHMKQDKGANPDTSSFGASLSGLVYKPDSKIGIGIMAGVKFGVVKEQLIDADVKFEIVFNSSGGLNRVYFEGNAKCIVPGVDIVPAKLKEAAQKFAGGEKLPFKPTDAAIAASVTMEMDFEKHSFHSMIGVYINVGPIIKGVGENGKAGWCVLHIDPDKWYLHIGSPTDPIGLKFLSLFEAKSYFMVGHGIPTELPLNPQVASILRIDPAKLSSNRDDGQLATGRGIAFGASVRFNTGDLTFLIFYASFDFGAGFDIMLVDVGSKSYCAGSSPPVGINGWYAKGQVYAYLKGEVGLKARIFGKTRRFEILSLAVAALLRAEAPNPTYILGIVGGQYKVFGGLIKGECRFKVEIGEKCQLVRVKDSPAPTDVPVIAEVTPGTDALDVDVFVMPQVVFNIPINKNFKISDDNEITKTYRIKLEKLELLNGGTPVTILQQWNKDNSVVAIEPDEILKSKDKYTLNVAISFEENVNGSWKILTDQSGAVFTENRTVSFTTGLLPERIPPHLISYSYPIDKQYNFYKGEYPQAYMMFSRNLSVYFNDDNDFIRECQWVENSGQKIRSRINYNPGERTVHVDIPANLKNNIIYNFSFVSVPRNTNNSSDRNVIINKTSVDLGDSTSAEMTTKEAEGMLSSGEEKVFYDHFFRTSKFNKLSEKIPFDKKDVDFLSSTLPFVFYPQINMPISEVFDNCELFGSETYEPLIRRTAVLINSNWYQQEVYPLLYKNKVWFRDNSIRNRDTSEFGLPPTKAINFYYRYPIVLTDDEIFTGVSQFGANTGIEYLFYKLPNYWALDYYDIRNYLANKYPGMSSSDTAVDKVLKNFDFPIIGPGNYPFLLEYVLPGKKIVTFSKHIGLRNNIKLNF